jgi:hypothetical protein
MVTTDPSSFTPSGWHRDPFEVHIALCELKLRDCEKILSALEERLRITPKPSEQLGWKLDKEDGRTA